MLGDRPTIAEARLAEIVPLVRVIIPEATAEEVRSLCTSTTDGEVRRRRWLSTASPREIALWVISNL